MTSVYSLADTKTVMYHPDVGQANLHQCGRGKMTVSWSGDLSSHTATADGYVVVNRLRSENGLLTLEVPQNSPADEYLRRWCRYLRSLQDPSRFLLTTVTVTDTAGGFTLHLTGVTPQKTPDRVFDRSSTNLTYTLLAANVVEQ